MAEAFDGEVALIGCGRLGSAILTGWLRTGAVAPDRLTVTTRSPKPAAEAARARGVRVDAPLDDLSRVRAVVLAVKPAGWREAVEPLLPHLATDATIVSVMAGVPGREIAEVTSRSVVRVMPTTAVAEAAGVAAVHAETDGARAVAHELFDPIATTVDIAEETMMDAATAVGGCGPAFVHAFTLAMARAGEAHGLSRDQALALARGAAASAVASAQNGDALEALIDRVAPPGGVTRAGLATLAQGDALNAVVAEAVEAAVAKSRAIRA